MVFTSLVVPVTKSLISTFSATMLLTSTVREVTSSPINSSFDSSTASIRSSTEIDLGT